MIDILLLSRYKIHSQQNEAVSISPEVLINKGINVNMLISSSLIISLLKVGLKLLLSILE